MKLSHIPEIQNLKLKLMTRMNNITFLKRFYKGSYINNSGIFLHFFTSPFLLGKLKLLFVAILGNFIVIIGQIYN